MAPSDDPPLSLRPQPVDDKKPKNLAEFIARVHAQPGGFRALSETSLREDIRKREEKEQNGEPTVDEDVQMADGDAHDDDEEANTAQDPNEARMEVLKNIEYVGNTLNDLV
jgi:mediator of RNA polymerase II transcription subunit 17